MAIDVIFIAGGVRERNRTFDAVREVLLPNPPATIDEAREALKSLTRREHRGEARPPEKPLPHSSFVFSGVSKLHLVVEHEPESGAVRETTLYYFASEPVNLETRDGLGGYMFPAWVIALAFGTYVALAAIWFLLYPRINRVLQVVVFAVYVLIVLVSFPVLAISTLNFYLWA